MSSVLFNFKSFFFNFVLFCFTQFVFWLCDWNRENDSIKREKERETDWSPIELRSLLDSIVRIARTLWGVKCRMSLMSRSTVLFHNQKEYLYVFKLQRASQEKVLSSDSHANWTIGLLMEKFARKNFNGVMNRICWWKNFQECDWYQFSIVN